MIEPEASAKLRTAFVAPLQIVADGVDCPPADKIWAAATGESSRSATAGVLLHCGECGACAEGWRLARIDVEASAAPVTRPNRLYLVAAAVAVVGLTGLIGMLIPMQSPAPPPVFRQQNPAEIRSTTGDLPLPREACVLSWTAAPAGSRYDLRITTESLDLLHTTWDLEETRFVVPPEALEPLQSGARLLWQVTTRPPGGRTVVSETFRVVIE